VVVLATVAVLGLVVLSSAPGGAAPATPGPTSAAGSGPPDSSLAADATATPTASLLPTASPTPSPTGTPSPSTASASPSPGPLVEHGYLVTLAELRERAQHDGSLEDLFLKLTGNDLNARPGQSVLERTGI